MQETKKEKKALKKAYKKARGKATRPWKALTWISGPLAIILAIATFVIGMFDNTFSVFVGGNFYTLENKDENAVLKLTGRMDRLDVYEDDEKVLYKVI